MKYNFTICKAELSDLEDIFDVFQSAILITAKAFYTSEQLDAWANTIYARKKIWQQRISNEVFIVAKLDGKIVGFAALKGNDYFDLLFVSPPFARRGIATLMYDHLESNIAKGTLLKTDASKLSFPFFLKKGFTPIAENKTDLLGVLITNQQMQKQL